MSRHTQKKQKHSAKEINQQNIAMIVGQVFS